ncbi:MAG: hypothetical protein V3R99_01910 [Thermoguttaceae bacterium]
MARTFSKIGPAAIAAIALSTLGGCVPPLGPPPSAGTTVTANTTVSPNTTAWANTTSMMPLDPGFLQTNTLTALSPEERIETALDEAVSTPFVGRSLFDLAAYFRRSCSINLVVDQVALNEAGIDGHLPADVTLSDVSLGCLLDAMLEPTDLTWTVRNESLLITTEEVAADIRVLKTHDVTELVSSPEGGISSSEQCQALIEMIEKHFAPAPGVSTRADPNDPVQIEAITVGNATVLVFSHQYRVHRRIEQFLNDLRAIARQHATRC